MYCLFDTETTNFPNKKFSPKSPQQGRICQFGCILLDENFKETDSFVTLVKPDATWNMTAGAQACHNITREMCEAKGIPMIEVFEKFNAIKQKAIVLAGHNLKFDMNLMMIEALVLGDVELIKSKHQFACTMELMTPIMKLPFTNGRRYGKEYKWPRCSEAYSFVTKGMSLEGAHDALADVRATGVILKYLVDNSIIKVDTSLAVA